MTIDEMQEENVVMRRRMNFIEDLIKVWKEEDEIRRKKFAKAVEIKDLRFNKSVKDFKKEMGYTKLSPKIIGLMRYVFEAVENNDEKRINFIKETIK